MSDSDMSSQKSIESRYDERFKSLAKSSSEDDESLSEMIKKKREQLFYGQNIKTSSHKEATFDLSDSYYSKTSQSQHSNLESRIKKLEKDFSMSINSTQKKQASPQNSSIQSYTITDTRQFEQRDPVNYQRRLKELKQYDNREPPVDWRNQRKIDNFNHDIQQLQEELERLKEEVEYQSNNERANRQKLQQKIGGQQKTEQSKRSRVQIQEEQILDSQPIQVNNELQEDIMDQKIRKQLEELKKEFMLDNSKQQIQEVQDNIDKLNSDLKSNKRQDTQKSQQENNKHDSIHSRNQSLDLVAKKQEKVHLEKEKENKQVQKESMFLPSSPLKKLDKQIEVLKQIERIRHKLKKSIKRKISEERIIEQYDPSYNMQAKTKILPKSTRQHCPNCAYLLNKGMSTAFCSCN